MNFRISNKSAMFLTDTLAGYKGRRSSLRFRSRSRPFQINITVTRYRRPKKERW